MILRNWGETIHTHYEKAIPTTAMIVVTPRETN